MNTIQKFDTIHQYNELLGQETLHPLVNVIDLAQSCRLRHGLHSFGFYTVFLKEIKIYFFYVSTIHLLLLKQKYEISRVIVSKDTTTPSDLLLFTSKQS